MTELDEYRKWADELSDKNSVLCKRAACSIRALVSEIESLKAQLEAKNKAPSHWDTAPEGAVKLVSCSGYNVYLNDKGEYFDDHFNDWDKDPDPEENILIDERTL